MRIQERPSDPMFTAAWDIADALVFRADQSVRLERTIQKRGLMNDRVTHFSNDIIRLDRLIQTRIQKWDDTFGPQLWTQYLDGYPRRKSLDSIMAVSNG